MSLKRRVTKVFYGEGRGACVVESKMRSEIIIVQDP